MTQIDGECCAPRYGIGRVRLDLHAADGEPQDVGWISHEFVQSRDDPMRCLKRIQTPAHRGRPGVGCLAKDIDDEPGCSLYAGHRADLRARRLQHRSLLDMWLDIAGRGAVCRPAREVRFGRLGAG